MRDPGLPTLLGRYVYGDNCNHGAALGGPRDAGHRRRRRASTSRAWLGFGEDACGRILVVSLAGPVSRIVDGTATPCDGPTPTPTATATPTADGDGDGDGDGVLSPLCPRRPAPAPRTADLRPCTITTRVTGLRSLRRRGYLSVALRTDEACRATISARGFRAVTTHLTPGARSVVKLRRTTSRARSIALRIEARDAAGNLRTLRRSVRAVR